MIDYLQDLEGRRADHISAKIFFDNLIVIYCGCYLKFGFLNMRTQPRAQNNQEEDDDSKPQDGNFLQEIKLQFSKDVEIVKMIETVRKNWLQIYTLDHELQIISIITWDFEQNTEQSILQWRFDRSESEIGYHLVKGMN